MKVHNPFKTHRILTVPGPKSKTVCLMHVIWCVVGLCVVRQNVKKPGGGMMKLTIKEKRQLWKEWQKGGDKEKYLQAKRKEKSAVCKEKSTRRQIW